MSHQGVSSPFCLATVAGDNASRKARDTSRQVPENFFSSSAKKVLHWPGKGVPLYPSQNVCSSVALLKRGSVALEGISGNVYHAV
ncbi:MAG: hypothetical protein CSA34_00020 [Desulfobulbus propionicus]|nr:MAG: hypothetical protein CSA34_00020 [Desulfobulbus propionicus]